MPGSSHIVRRPVKDAMGQVLGYELVCGERLSDEKNSSSFAVAEAVHGFLARNARKALQGELHFLTCDTTFLMKRIPRLFDPADLVIQIGEDVITHPLALYLARKYREEGYRLAANDFQFSPLYLERMDEFDFLRLNFQNSSDVSLHNAIQTASDIGKSCIGFGVDRAELYQKALQSGVHFMEGLYVSDQFAVKPRGKGYLQSEFFHLLAEITAESPDLQQIERIITLDSSMHSVWMRIANSRYFAYGSETTSVWQALIKLGVGQLRELCCLLCAWTANGLDEDYQELMTHTLTRAHFCAQLTNYCRGYRLSRREAYLTGLFSTLPMLVDASIEAVLKNIPLRNDVRGALVRQEGPLGELLRLVLSFEASDWEQVDYLCASLQIPETLLTNAYFECVETARTLWRELNEEGTA